MSGLNTLDFTVVDTGQVAGFVVASLSGSADPATGAVATPVPTDPGVYSMSVDAQSMQVDLVSVHALAADNVKDGVFDLTLVGPITELSLYTTDAAGNASGGQIWDTTPNDATWTLGVQENGKLLNNADSSLPTGALGAGVHTLRLFADNSGYFSTGQHYRVSFRKADNSVGYGPVLTY